MTSLLYKNWAMTTFKRYVSVKQIQKLDELAIKKYGIPSIVLMENAGRSVAHEVIRLVKQRRNPQVMIVCGLGNNASDGFIAARYLINAGIKTKIFLLGTANDLKHDAATNYQILKKLKFSIKEVHVVDQSIIREATKADLVVDAIFGVGLNRNVAQPFLSMIEMLNRWARYVVAVDIPSGLNGTTGKMCGVCVKAHTTVTFSFPKKGFFLCAGPQHVGRIVVADIGIPAVIKSRV